MGCGASKPDVIEHFGQDGMAKSNGNKAPGPDDAFNYSSAAQIPKHTVRHRAFPGSQEPFRQLTILS